MPEIKTTRTDLRTKQMHALTALDIAENDAYLIMDKFRDLEDKRSIADLVRDCVEDSSIEEVQMLLDRLRYDKNGRNPYGDETITKLAILKALQDRIVTFTARAASGENLDKQAAYMADELISLCFELATSHRHLYQITFTSGDDIAYTCIVLNSSHTEATHTGETIARLASHRLYCVDYLSLRDLLNGGTL